MTPRRVADAARAERVMCAGDELAALVAAVCAELTGLGPLEALVADDETTDVLVNGPADVWRDRGAGLERADVRFEDDAAVARLARRLAAAAGRRLDDAVPWVDARLPDGTRLHAVLAPVASPGSCLSLRLPRRRGFELDELVHPETAELLRAVVASRAAFLVTGGTGSGKTTVLSALLSCVPERERIVVVEDCRELRPTHPHVVRLEARPANVEGAGAVVLRDLVRQALRMRPDRLVVGEVRGGEVVDLMAALNTGHEGGCGTVHANEPAQLPSRVEALAGAAGLPREAAHSQLGAAVDLVVHLARRPSGERGVAEVAVLSRGPSGLVEVVTAMRSDASGRLLPGPGAAQLRSVLHR
ncbi:MAG: pilus assembly protein CpaF [Frankiaceae bacterium]|nr:pilus assembly protein CpaF [Frankiaceae bacterium]